MSLVPAACGGGSQTGIDLEREVRGDTTIVRLSGTPVEMGVREEVRIGSLDGADEYTFGNVAGTVRLPARFSPMFMRGEHVWGVVRDDLDVPYIARLAVERRAM